MRRIGWAAMAVGATLGGLVIADAVTGNPAQTYQTAAVVRTNLVTTVTASGTLRPVMTVKVGAQLSGQIDELYVDFNDKVTRGQPLARINPEAFEAQLRTAQAALESAHTNAAIRQAMGEQAEALLTGKNAERAVLIARRDKAQAHLGEARRELDRKLRLRGQGNVSVSEVESAQAAFDAMTAELRETDAEMAVQAAEIREAEASLRVAQAEGANAEAAVEHQRALVEEAEVELQRTVIRAPIDGVVVGREVDRGQTVATGLEAPTLFSLARDLRQMTVQARVDEADIGAIRKGQRATFRVDAYRERTFEGIVTQIRMSPEVVQNVVTYVTVIDVANPDLLLLPGMTATVEIAVLEVPHALVVPNAALRFRNEDALEALPVDGRPAGDKAARTATVWIPGSANQPTPVQIEIRSGDDRFAEIVSGPLAEGDKVIVGVADASAGTSGFAIRFGF
jgi:HlyD family secretion protein